MNQMDFQRSVIREELFDGKQPEELIPAKPQKKLVQIPQEYRKPRILRSAIIRDTDKK